MDSYRDSGNCFIWGCVCLGGELANSLSDMTLETPRGSRVGRQWYNSRVADGNLGRQKMNRIIELRTANSLKS